MEQNTEGRETPNQHAIDDDWNGVMNQTLEQALQSERVQKSFQQLHKFNGAQPIKRGNLPTVGESNPVQAEQAHYNKEPFEYHHPQLQITGELHLKPRPNEKHTLHSSATDLCKLPYPPECWNVPPLALPLPPLLSRSWRLRRCTSVCSSLTRRTRSVLFVRRELSSISVVE